MAFTPTTATVTEPTSGTVSQSVTLSADGSQQEGGITTYDIDSVVCNQLSEFIKVDGQKAITITHTNTSFTIVSSFKDLFNRTFKYVRHYPKEFLKWKNKDLQSPNIVADGTKIVKVVVNNAELFRPNDTIRISAATVESNEKDKIAGTWKINTVTGYTDLSSQSQKFKEFTFEVNENVAAGVYTLLEVPYNTYHVVNRIRFVANIDEDTVVEPYTGVYEMTPPPGSRTLSFTVSGIKTYTSYSTNQTTGVTTAGTPVQSPFSLTWTMTLNSSFEISQNALQVAVESGSDYVENQTNNPSIP